MKLRRRETEVFSLSFLDCICCGFGAIILLLVLTEFGQPVVLERSRKDLRGQVLQLQQELFEIRGESDQLTRELKGRIDLMQQEKRNLGKLAGDVSRARGEFESSRKEAVVANTIEAELIKAYNELNQELERRIAERPPRRVSSDIVGGIPIDSEYVVFMIDTSSSMTDNHWPTAIAVMQEVLSIYPALKGVQVLNDNGIPMFDGTRGRWLDDSPALRADIIRRMRTWRAFSDSNPVDGIEESLRYARSTRGVSVYVMGDEFTGASIQQALDAVALANRGPDGKHLARIHAIGFPEGPNYPPFTNRAFSALMRAIVDRNGGSFVGITNEKACVSWAVIGGVRQCTRS
jgi:hypothetical protein